MAIHIRNLYAGTGSTTYAFWAYNLVTLREMFLAGRWTDNTFLNQTEYDNNIISGPSDCQVNPASPLLIYSPGGGFTGYHDYGLTLLATNDQNRGVFRVRLIDDNTVQVYNPPPAGWTTETGISCRLFNWGATDPIANNNYMFMDPPVGTNTMRMQTWNGYQTYHYAYPNGYPGNHSGSFSILDANYQATRGYINAFFEDATAIIYFRDIFNAGIFRFAMWGELEGVGTGDTYPGFQAAEYFYDYTTEQLYQTLTYKMINSVTVTQQEVWYMSALGRGIQIVNDTNRINKKLGARSIHGKAKLTKPWLFEGTSVGGFFRGKVPHIRMCNENWEPNRFMNSAKTWRHLASGLCVPGAGPNDPEYLGG